MQHTLKGKSANDLTLRPFCSLCGEVYEGIGHNPYPLGRGRCCDKCNSNKVVPERIQQMHLAEEKAEKRRKK